MIIYHQAPAFISLSNATPDVNEIWFLGAFPCFHMILHDSNVIVTSITGLNEHLIDKSIKTGFFLQKKYVKPMMHDFSR